MALAMAPMALGKRNFGVKEGSGMLQGSQRLSQSVISSDCRISDGP